MKDMNLPVLNQASKTKAKKTTTISPLAPPQLKASGLSGQKSDVRSLYPQSTPRLKMHLSKINSAYQMLKDAIPGVAIYYAMKCNPNHAVIDYIYKLGSNFEIASAYELDELITLGIDPSTVLFSNPVKHSEHILYAYQKGVDRFAFDSYLEVDKIAVNAPGARVYIRLAAPMTNSVVASEGKFGVSIDEAEKLMHYAKEKGLQPYGIAFHVGSQMLEPDAWKHAIRTSGMLMMRLKEQDIELTMLNIGGGFPAKYENAATMNLKKICNEIVASIEEYIPYPVELVAEPGRYLVADAGVVEATVIGVAYRFDKKWVHLDVGAMNGFLEALETGRDLQFPVTDSRNSSEKDICVLTGPTCDSQDTIMDEVALSTDITEGDKVYIACAGAYTTTYTRNFNGFPNPIEEIQL